MQIVAELFVSILIRDWRSLAQTKRAAWQRKRARDGVRGRGRVKTAGKCESVRESESLRGDASTEVSNTDSVPRPEIVRVSESMKGCERV